MTARAASPVNPHRKALHLLRGRRFAVLRHQTLQVMRAKWQLRQATSVGTVRLTGRARVINFGTITFADRVLLDGGTVRLEFAAFDGGTLSIGEGTYINYGTNISATRSVTIGRRCSIGQYCIIMDNDYHGLVARNDRPPGRPVVIEDNVWLAARVIVLPGSRIGQGSVIAANSVVRGEIPPLSLAAGSPAKVMRTLTGAHS